MNSLSLVMPLSDQSRKKSAGCAVFKDWKVTVTRLNVPAAQGAGFSVGVGLAYLVRIKCEEFMINSRNVITLFLVLPCPKAERCGCNGKPFFLRTLFVHCDNPGGNHRHTVALCVVFQSSIV